MTEPFIIADIGSSHGRRLSYALRLLEAARSAGCRAAKFQYWSSSARLADRLHAPEAQELYERVRFPAAWLPILAQQTHELGMEFLCTVDLPEDIPAVAPYVDRFKIASWGATDITFILEHAVQEKPLVISTGLCSVQELEALRTGAWTNVTWLLHCVSAYPAPVQDLNLAAIRACGLDGFSDHTGQVETGAMAVMAGARVLEVHIRLPDDEADRQNPDYGHSLPPASLLRYTGLARRAARALGDGVKRTMPSEVPNLRHRYVSVDG